MTLDLVKELFGHPIAAHVTFLDDGAHVLLTGGQRSHIGAISLAQSGRLLASVSYPGHKEQVISDVWAVRLSG